MNRRSFIERAIKLGLSVISTPAILSASELSDTEVIKDFIEDNNNKNDDAFKKELTGFIRSERKKIKVAERGSSYGVKLYNVHTGESYDMIYRRNGVYVGKAIQKFAHFMRDYRTGDVRYIDPRLLDVLASLHIKTNSERAFSVLSGFRSKKTNEWLRKHGHKAAKHSYHIRGKAIDIASPSVSTLALYQTAKKLNRGGVGYYPNNHFVHTDVGPIRHWKG